MTYDLLLALAGFAFVTSITPGPNNLMLMASGANFGFLRSIPHMLGIGIGFMLMLAVVGLGLVQVFLFYPQAQMALTIISVIYLCYLAWKIANASPPGHATVTGTPMTFLQAAAFQWVNPKAWAMALPAMTAYAPDQSLISVGVVALVFGMINIPCVSVWTVLGQQIRRILTNPLRLRVFNIGMAVLLIASLYPVIFPTGSG